MSSLISTATIWMENKQKKKVRRGRKLGDIENFTQNISLPERPQTMKRKSALEGKDNETDIERDVDNERDQRDIDNDRGMDDDRGNGNGNGNRNRNKDKDKNRNKNEKDSEKEREREREREKEMESEMGMEVEMEGEEVMQEYDDFRIEEPFTAYHASDHDTRGYDNAYSSANNSSAYRTSGGGGGGGDDNDKPKLFEKLGYITHLLEQQQNEKTANMWEEYILYILLGTFMICTIDSFARSTRYIR